MTRLDNLQQPRQCYQHTSQSRLLKHSRGQEQVWYYRPKFALLEVNALKIRGLSASGETEVGKSAFRLSKEHASLLQPRNLWY